MLAADVVEGIGIGIPPNSAKLLALLLLPIVLPTFDIAPVELPKFNGLLLFHPFNDDVDGPMTSPPIRMLLSLDGCSSDNVETALVGFDLLGWPIFVGILIVAERPLLDEDCFLPFRTPGILLLLFIISSSLTTGNAFPLIVDVLRFSGVNAVNVKCCCAASVPSFDVGARRLLATTDAAVVAFGVAFVDAVAIPDCVFRCVLIPTPIVGLVLLVLDVAIPCNTPTDTARPTFAAGTLVALT